jgi:hypothetical protein
MQPDVRYVLVAFAPDHRAEKIADVFESTKISRVRLVHENSVIAHATRHESGWRFHVDPRLLFPGWDRLGHHKQDAIKAMQGAFNAFIAFGKGLRDQDRLGSKVIVEGDFGKPAPDIEMTPKLIQAIRKAVR